MFPLCSEDEYLKYFPGQIVDAMQNCLDIDRLLPSMLYINFGLHESCTFNGVLTTVVRDFGLRRRPLSCVALD
jgi:hypothetical protein